MSLHPELAEHIEQAFPDRLAAPPQLAQDALTLILDNGVMLTVHYAADDAYSLRWRTGPGADAVEMGIDTAPTHPDLATVPNHLHLGDGRAVPDPVTRVGAKPAANLTALVEALLQDPHLHGKTP